VKPFHVENRQHKTDCYVPRMVSARADAMTMDVFLSQSTLERRTNKCHRTIADRIATGVIVPDAVAVLGTKEVLLFKADRLTDIRRALALDTSKEIAL
jgi:hypothetical protein